MICGHFSGVAILFNENDADTYERARLGSGVYTLLALLRRTVADEAVEIKIPALSISDFAKCRPMLGI